MATKQSKYGRRFDEEFKRGVAALASRPGATIEQVGRDPGVSPRSMARWRRKYRPAEPARNGSPASTPVVAANRGSASVPELERQIKALRRENAGPREQGTILKKAVAIFPEAPR